MAEMNNEPATAKNLPIITTIAANCRDCYRCVRSCPVKAIRVENGQAHVEDHLCIKCGTCVRECPQHAKTMLSSLPKVKDMLASDRLVVASVAPSFAAQFSGGQTMRLPSALRQLGFAHVLETAEGAKRISIQAEQELGQARICTACPVVVDYIEKYRPEVLPQLLPVVSPMVAHGRMIKEKYGPDCAVVFIGPCVAKKAEARKEGSKDAIDAVLTFEELRQWLDQEGVDLNLCPDSGFDQTGFCGGDLDQARLFPLEGGMLTTCGLSADSIGKNTLFISGSANVIDLLSNELDDLPYQMIEPLFCSGGCINGPCFAPHDMAKTDEENEEPIEEGSLFSRKLRIIDYAELQKKDPLAHMTRPELHDINIKANFAADTSLALRPVSEEEINRILASTGKGSPEMQMNCGACGYNTCRDKAIAVARGMAEPEMCLPQMRRLSRQRMDKIIQTSPNGVVILDHNLNIIHMNEAFHKMFMCSDTILGRRISYLLSADGFEKLALGKEEKCEAVKVKYGIKYHELAYVLPNEEQYVGIYTNISHVAIDGQQLDLIKQQSLAHTRELLDQQIHFYQEMAHQLGRSMAQNEELVKRLMELYEEQSK